MREKATLKKDHKKDLLLSRLIYFVYSSSRNTRDFSRGYYAQDSRASLELRTCRQIPHPLSFDFPDFLCHGRVKYAVVSDALIVIIPSSP